MNFTEALDSRGIRWKKSGRENEIWLCCPFCEERGHTPDSRFRLGVNLANGNGHCFQCEWRRRGIAIIKLRTKLDLGDWVDVSASSFQPKEKIVVKLPDDFTVLSARDKSYWGRTIYRYVRGRRVTDEQIKRYGIGFTEVGPYAYRVVVPIRYKGKLCGLVSRTIKKKGRYKNSLGDKALFGFIHQDDSSIGNRKAVLLEGFFDALAVDRAVNRYGWVALAALGHTLTGRQIDMIRQFEEVVIWFDPDKPGIDGTIVVANQLANYVKVRVVMPTDDQRDPDELPIKTRRARIINSRPWSTEMQHRLQAWLTYQED